MKNLSYADRDNIECLYESGMALRPLAARYDISHESIREILIERDIPRRDHRCGSVRRLDDEREQKLIAEYQRGASSRSLGERFGLSHTGVLRLLRRSNIQRRKPGLPRGLNESAFDQPLTAHAAFLLGYSWANGVDSDRPSREPVTTVTAPPSLKHILDDLKLHLRTSLRVRYMPARTVRQYGVPFVEREHFFLRIRSRKLASRLRALDPRRLPHLRSFVTGAITRRGWREIDDLRDEFIVVQDLVEHVEWLRLYLAAACPDWRLAYEHDSWRKDGRLTIGIGQEELFDRLHEDEPAEKPHGTTCQMASPLAHFEPTTA